MDDKNKIYIKITMENDCPDGVLENIEWYIKEFSYFIIDVKIIEKDNR